MSLLYPSYEASERSRHLGRTTRLPTPRNRCLLSIFYGNPSTEYLGEMVRFQGVRRGL